MNERYNAFLSYSHTADGSLAPALQQGLQRLGKPWYRRPVIKIFRDETSLAANPGLWSGIERHLSQSEYFILMASVQAAQSPWVRKEVEWWLYHRAVESLFIVVTTGEIIWDRERRDFDWQKTTCLPPELRGHHREEPLFVDLRWARGQDDLTLHHPKFRAAVLTLAAPLHGRAKEELDNEDIRQHHRFKVVATAVAAVLVVLMIVSVYGIRSARDEAVKADRNRRDAESRKLAAKAMEVLGQREGIERAIHLGVLAWRFAPTQEASSALQKIGQASSDLARILGQHTKAVSTLAFSPDSSILATGSDDGIIRLWRVNSWEPIGPPLAGERQDMQEMLFDASGAHLLTRGSVSVPDGEDQVNLTLWDVQSQKLLKNWRKGNLT